MALSCPDNGGNRFRVKKYMKKTCSENFFLPNLPQNNYRTSKNVRKRQKILKKVMDMRFFAFLDLQMVKLPLTRGGFEIYVQFSMKNMPSHNFIHHFNVYG